MDYEARRAELEQMIRDEFLGSPKAWQQGWRVLARLYKEGEVYATTMAAKVLAKNRPAKTVPPEEVVTFAQILRIVHNAKHVKKEHTYTSVSVPGQDTESCGECKVRAANTANLSLQEKMVYEAKVHE